jgi:2-(1,2-epoxy-1,2-dihydrophenyl)acetyl-CoA isomerase
MNSLKLELAPSGVATLTLTQGARGNPIDGDFVVDFKRAVLKLYDMPGLRAVLLRAEGDNFSVGGDLKALRHDVASLPSLVRSWTSDLHMGLARLWHLPVPILAEVHGLAVGGALGLMAGCDIIVCSESAKFAAAFAKIGFSCDSGTSAVLTNRMGPARAKRFQLLGEILSATQAEQTGLVDRVVPYADLAREALATVNAMAEGPTVAYGEIKRLFLRAAGIQLEAQLEDEALTLARVASSKDAQEGVTAFTERRTAVFTGT